jgi:hypothetical protein
MSGKFTNRTDGRAKPEPPSSSRRGSRDDRSARTDHGAGFSPGQSASRASPTSPEVRPACLRSPSDVRRAGVQLGWCMVRLSASAFDVRRSPPVPLPDRPLSRTRCLLHPHPLSSRSGHPIAPPCCAAPCVAVARASVVPSPAADRFPAAPPRASAHEIANDITEVPSKNLSKSHFPIFVMLMVVSITRGRSTQDSHGLFVRNVFQKY